MQDIKRIYALSKRNVILRYKNSLVGFLWGFLKPLIYLLIFMVVFSHNFPDLNNYILYATSGLILWFFFANVTGQSVGSIVGSSGLLKSLSIPAYFFPLSEMISEMFNLALTIIVFLIFMHWFGLVYSIKLLLIIPAALLFATFTYGLNLLLCSVNVFFRDIGIIWATIQPALFYITPIAYPETNIPEGADVVVRLNPIYPFIKLGRGILYENSYPSMHDWNKCLLIAIIMLGFGQFVFSRLRKQFISAI